MRGTEEPGVVTAIGTALEQCSAVTSVTLGGSRERGRATELSDWDLYLEGDPAHMMVEVPAIIASFRPLAASWEPLAEEAGYMVVLVAPSTSAHGRPRWTPSDPELGRQVSKALQRHGVIT